MAQGGYSRLRKGLLDEHFVEGALQHVCPYCGLTLTRALASLDHNPPLSRRKRKRSDLRASTILACRACNSKKGKQSIDEFRTWLASKQGARWVKGFYCSGCHRRWGFCGGPKIRPCPRCGGKNIERRPPSPLAELLALPYIEHGALRVSLGELSRRGG